MCNDQMVLRIDRCLHVVADDSRAARHHGASVGVGQSDLFIRRFIELDFDRLKLLHLSFEHGDFLFQPHGTGL